MALGNLDKLGRPIPERGIFEIGPLELAPGRSKYVLAELSAIVAPGERALHCARRPNPGWNGFVPLHGNRQPLGVHLHHQNQ